MLRFHVNDSFMGICVKNILELMMHTNKMTN